MPIIQMVIELDTDTGGINVAPIPPNPLMALGLMALGTEVVKAHFLASAQQQENSRIVQATMVPPTRLR